MMVKADRVLAAELSLLGRFVHLRTCLAHRWKPQWETVHSAKYLKRYRPDRSKELQSGSWRLFRSLVSVLWSAPLDSSQRWVCMRAALGVFWKESRSRTRKRLISALRRLLGLARGQIGLFRRAPR